MSEENKIIYGYEDKPPQCGNCKSMQQKHEGGWHEYFCSFGQFSVRPGGICDRYIGRFDGSTLEGSKSWREGMKMVAARLALNQDGWDG